MLILLFMLLGYFIDGISLVVLTAAEMSQITPSVAFNLYVLQSLTGRDMFYIARASLPLFLLQMVAVTLTWVFPQIVTFLPGRIFDLAN